MTSELHFIELSVELEQSGLIWHPEIGDEVIARDKPSRVSILVDPAGMSLKELRINYIWLPTVEQLVNQFEAREALIHHVGINQNFIYEAVIKTSYGAIIETNAPTIRLVFGAALKDLIKEKTQVSVH